MNLIQKAKINFNKLTNTENLFLDYSENCGNLFFVQIGANDGVMNDPLHRHIAALHWSGILIEPVNYYYQVLCKMYEGKENLICENVAISPDFESMTIYRIDENVIEEKFPGNGWLHGQGSFNKDNVIAEILRHFPEDGGILKENIREENVKCMSLEKVLHKHNVENIDLLAIDTQGYDYQILNSIDFNVIRPGIILFESEFSAGYTSCIDRLKSMRYEIFSANDHDTVMIDSSVKFLRQRRRSKNIIEKLRALKSRVLARNS